MTTGWRIATVAAIVGWVAACAPARPAAVAGPTLDVCEAALEPIGSRIVVRGELITPGRSFTLATSGPQLCNSHGAGLVFVDFFDDSERKRVYYSKPRPKRTPGVGDFVTVEGTIEKITEQRFSYLRDAVVRSVEPERGR